MSAFYPESVTEPEPPRRPTAAAWLQTAALAVIAVCVLVLTVDAIYLQWSLAQALNDIGQQIEEFGNQFGNGGGDEPTPPPYPGCPDPSIPC